MIRDKKIHNETLDITWLKEQIKASSFDLYSTVTKDDQEFVFGCIQAKTSIRDRVTRDREPSMHAMEAFFWSVAICLNGAFLSLPKFRDMVNGGSPSFPENGWHGLYVFSKNYEGDRIYPLGNNLSTFASHAKQASDHWLSQRQWLNYKWKAE